MLVGVLGMGRAGQRHYQNARLLGHDVIGHDLDVKKSEVQRAVILQADAIVIATPAEQHLNDLRDAIPTGKPILIEKPLALTGQSHLVAQLDLSRVWVGYNLRFHWLMPQIRGDFNLAEAYYASFVCCQATEQPSPIVNGVANDWLCHEVDLAMHLLGPLRPVHYSSDHLQADVLAWSWERKLHVTIHSDMIATEPVRRLLIVAEDRSFDYDLQHADPVRDADYRLELQAFLDGAKAPLASGAEGLEVLRFCERVDGYRRRMAG